MQSSAASLPHHHRIILEHTAPQIWDDERAAALCCSCTESKFPLQQNNPLVLCIIGRPVHRSVLHLGVAVKHRSTDHCNLNGLGEELIPLQSAFSKKLHLGHEEHLLLLEPRLPRGLDDLLVNILIRMPEGRLRHQALLQRVPPSSFKPASDVESTCRIHEEQPLGVLGPLLQSDLRDECLAALDHHLVPAVDLIHLGHRGHPCGAFLLLPELLLD
mmetsp:Transcript_104034/g.238198  ORF Transcript_104034/g.238198 Transcript_104034/m.238198 type:complete len:216 (+) Transcript_104034:1099-1746(+)